MVRCVRALQSEGVYAKTGLKLKGFGTLTCPVLNAETGIC